MKICNFKKIISILFFVIILISLFTLNMPNVKADTKLNFSLSTDSVDNNRLFDVDLVVDGNANLSACNVAITYDTSHVEFRSVSSPDKAFEIKKKISNGKVSAIILCSYGYSLNGKSKIISFKFKSIDSGSSNFGLSVFDPVDSNGDKLSIGTVYGAKVTINDGKVTSKSIKSGNRKSNSTKSNSISNGGLSNSGNISSDSVKVPKVNYAGSYDNDESVTTSSTSPMDTAYSDNSEPHSLFFIGVLSTVGFVLIICIAYRMGKTGKENNDKEINKEDK